MPQKSPKKHGPVRRDSKLSLAPLGFETAVAAAMATGSPPKAKRKPKTQKAKK
jgi:hypothetical protein